jgi:hypothetical protein
VEGGIERMDDILSVMHVTSHFGHNIVYCGHYYCQFLFNFVLTVS